MSINKLNSKNSGQALVEFALIIIVLLMLITFVIEIGRITWAWAAVQSSARSGARYAITGNFEANICASSPDADCLARTESVHNVALQGLTGWPIREDVAFQDDNYTAVQIFGYNSALPAGEQLQEGYAGEPGQPVVVRVTYNVPVITPLFRPIVENVPVFGQVTLTNELFGRQGGRTEGVSLPPPLPALPKVGPTDTPTPTPTETTVPTVDPGAPATETPTPLPVITCGVKFQDDLIERRRILRITGDLYKGNDANNPEYTVKILDRTNRREIATRIPFGSIGDESFDHGCTNGNQGLIEFDLGSLEDGSPYKSGLPGNIYVVVEHENGSEDSEYVEAAADATATVLAPTATSFPTQTPTATPNQTATPLPPSAFIRFFPGGGSCVSRDPVTNTIRFRLDGGNWAANRTIKFSWNNQNDLPFTATSDGNGVIAPFQVDLGNIAAGVHTLTAFDGAGHSHAKRITIPCPVPTPTVTPTPTPTLLPPDLIISAPKLQTSFPINAYTQVKFTFQITNTGETDINSLFFVDLFLDPPAGAFVTETTPISRTSIIVDPYSDGYIAVPDMAANSSRLITITASGGFDNSVTGLREAWGMVDSIDSITIEEREDNNVSSVGGIPVTPAAVPPPVTVTPGDPSPPFSIQGIVNAYYTQFVPQMRATVYLVEQPAGGGQGTVVAQDDSDSNGRYAFYNVPDLTGGASYTIVACLPLAGSDAFSGSWPSVLPEADQATNIDLYMIVDVTGCPY